MAKTYKKKMPAKKAARRTPGGKARKTKKTGVKKAVKAALAKAKANPPTQCQAYYPRNWHLNASRHFSHAPIKHSVFARRLCRPLISLPGSDQPGTQPSTFSDASLDFVYSSHCLEHLAINLSVEELVQNSRPFQQYRADRAHHRIPPDARRETVPQRPLIQTKKSIAQRNPVCQTALGN
jgi:hypothetical protein